MTTTALPENDRTKQRASALSRRHMLLTGTSALAAAGLTAGQVSQAQAQPAPPPRPPALSGRKPNILVIFGDDIGLWNVSAYNRGMMGYRTPNIDRIAKEGAIFTDAYGQQSCTAGRRPSSSARSRSAPACSPSACRAIRTASPNGCRPSPT